MLQYFLSHMTPPQLFGMFYGWKWNEARGQSERKSSIECLRARFKNLARSEGHRQFKSHSSLSLIEFSSLSSFTRPSELIWITEFGNFTFMFRKIGPKRKLFFTSPDVRWRPTTIFMKASDSFVRSTRWTPLRWLGTRMCFSTGLCHCTWITRM